MVANLVVQVFLQQQVPSLQQHLRQVLEQGRGNAGLEDWIWQVLSLWHHQKIPPAVQADPQEPMFWHSLFSLHELMGEALAAEQREELSLCLAFFDGNMAQPDWCVGSRPIDDEEGLIEADWL